MLELKASDRVFHVVRSRVLCSQPILSERMWNEYLKVLDTAAERHLTLVQEIRDASKDQLNIPIDYYVNAVVSRSLHMLNGFRCLARFLHQTVVCAEVGYVRS